MLISALSDTRGEITRGPRPLATRSRSGPPFGRSVPLRGAVKTHLVVCREFEFEPQAFRFEGPRGSGALRDGLKIWSLARFTTRTARQSSGTAKTMRARRRVMPHVAYICEIWHSAFVKPVIWMGGSREEVKRLPEAVQDSLGFELYRVQSGLDPKDWKLMTRVGSGVKEVRVRDEGNFPDDLSRDATRGSVRIALLSEEDATNKPGRSGTGDEAI